MELDEVALMQRFDSAVADLAPDVTSLVEGGHLRGNAMRRRRRLTAGAGAVVAAAVTVGAVALAQGVFDHESAGPTTPNPTGVEQLVPATPRGLAAGLVDVLDVGDPTATAGEVITDDRSGLVMQVGAAYQIDGAKVAVELFASDNPSDWVGSGTCAEVKKHETGLYGVAWCDATPLADGTPAIRVLLTKPQAEGDTAAASAFVAVKRDDSVVSSYETVPGTWRGAPITEDTVPISFDQLIRVVSDPRIGVQTTAGYNTTGEGLDNFHDRMTTRSSSSGGDSVTTEVETSTPQKAGGN